MSTPLQTRDIYKHSFFPLFYSKSFKEKAFPACIAAAPGIKAVAMQRANKITQSIYISISQYAAGMRTFMSAGKEGFLMHSHRNGFSGNSKLGQAIRRKFYFGNAFSDLMPGGLVDWFSILVV